MATNWNEIGKQIFKFYDKESIAIAEHVLQFEQRMAHDPAKAIPDFRRVLETALDDIYDPPDQRKIPFSLMGGPHEAAPLAMINAVGTVYPFLERRQKDAALSQVLGFLDGQNYFYVQSLYTCSVRDPALLSDIVVARRLYWPGYDENTVRWQYHTESPAKSPKDAQSYYEIHEAVLDGNGLFRKGTVASDFIAACALLDKRTNPFSKEYAEAAHPGFLRRTANGATARYLSFTTPNERDHNRASLKRDFPESTHRMIDEAERAVDWVKDERICWNNYQSLDQRLREEKEQSR